ncbi:type I toxin-antitoxin system Fst family toxin [Ligilactobacillus sp. 110_WCHN]
MATSLGRRRVCMGIYIFQNIVTPLLVGCGVALFTWWLNKR